jgi:DNA invertase Pin-like site-specific DNA recombinase
MFTFPVKEANFSVECHRVIREVRLYVSIQRGSFSIKAALDYIRDGDTLVVHSMDRLARSLDDLRRIVKELTARGVIVEFLKERLTFTGEDNAMANLLLSVMGAFAEFERALLKERQREGIALAKKAGAYKGRKRALTPERVKELHQRVKDGEKKAAVAREFGISRETLYSYLAGSHSALQKA